MLQLETEVSDLTRQLQLTLHEAQRRANGGTPRSGFGRPPAFALGSPGGVQQQVVESGAELL